MKGICFTFDAFGQWSEHGMSKMEWRPCMANRSKIGGWLSTFSLISSFPLHYLPI
jgi:hypothetical protein